MSSPILGGLTLSGATHVVITDNDYVMEHQVPGMDGGIVERIGSDLFRIKIQGFSSSGDADKPQFLAMLNTSQSLNVPSTVPSTSFFSGSVYIKEFNIGPLAGRGYPVYSWVINTLASGQLNAVVPAFVLSGLPLFGLDYSQNQPFGVALTIDYAQNLPLNAGLTLDYAQNLQLFASLTLDYAQNIPLNAGLTMNYHKMISGTEH